MTANLFIVFSAGRHQDVLHDVRMMFGHVSGVTGGIDCTIETRLGNDVARSQKIPTKKLKATFDKLKTLTSGFERAGAFNTADNAGFELMVRV